MSNTISMNKPSLSFVSMDIGFRHGYTNTMEWAPGFEDCVVRVEFVSQCVSEMEAQAATYAYPGVGPWDIFDWKETCEYLADMIMERFTSASTSGSPNLLARMALTLHKDNDERSRKTA